MKTDEAQTRTLTFEGHAQRATGGVEFLLARDLQHLLGYAESRDFGGVLGEARTACEVSGHRVTDHFVEVNNMVDLSYGSHCKVDELMLTRYH